MTFHQIIDWAMMHGKVLTVAVVGGLSGLGLAADAVNNFGVITGIIPWATRTWVTEELDTRKAARDKELAATAEKVASDLAGYNAKVAADLAAANKKVTSDIAQVNSRVTDIQEQSLSWRVADYPARILDLQTGLATLTASLPDATTPVIRQQLDKQIQQTNAQIKAMEKAQEREGCLLRNINRVVPFVCPP